MRINLDLLRVEYSRGGCDLAYEILHSLSRNKGGRKYYWLICCERKTLLNGRQIRLISSSEQIFLEEVLLWKNFPKQWVDLIMVVGG